MKRIILLVMLMTVVSLYEVIAQDKQLPLKPAISFVEHCKGLSGPELINEFLRLDAVIIASAYTKDGSEYFIAWADANYDYIFYMAHFVDFESRCHRFSLLTTSETLAHNWDVQSKWPEFLTLDIRLWKGETYFYAVLDEYDR